MIIDQCLGECMCMCSYGFVLTTYWIKIFFRNSHYISKSTETTCLFSLHHDRQHLSSYYNTFSRRCFLWCPVHRYGRSCFIDGERFTGKHTFSIRQHHYLLEFGIALRLTLRFYCAVYSGCSVSVWLDQRATSWSLPTRNAIPHHKLSSEYILSPELPQTKKNKQTATTKTKHTFWKYLIVGLHLAGRAVGYDHWPGGDLVGVDWWPDLPSDSWYDRSSPTYHCGLHKLHHCSPVNQPPDSAHTAKVSYKEEFSQGPGAKKTKN